MPASGEMAVFIVSTAVKDIARHFPFKNALKLSWNSLGKVGREGCNKTGALTATA